jgi:Flp pilus assembly protein TadD
MIPFLSTDRRTLALIAALLLGACAAEPGIDQAGDRQDDVTLLAVDLHRDHGWAALRAERYEESASYFKRILKERAGDPDAMLGLGEALLGQNRLDDALARFEQVDREAAPSLRARAVQGQAIVWLRRGRHDKAEAGLNEALELDPSLWRAWNGLGRVRDAEKDYVAARYAYRQAIAINPKIALLHNNLGFSLLASGDPAFAERSLRQALELDPELDVAVANLRLALALQGRYQPALAGASASERATVMNNVGYAALLRGDHGKARSLFLGAMELDPGFFQEARRNLAYLETLEADRSWGE